MRPEGGDVGGSHPSDSDDDGVGARVTVLSAKIRTRVNYNVSAKASENMGLEVEKAFYKYLTMKFTQLTIFLLIFI